MLIFEEIMITWRVDYITIRSGERLLDMPNLVLFLRIMHEKQLRILENSRKWNWSDLNYFWNIVSQITYQLVGPRRVNKQPNVLHAIQKHSYAYPACTHAIL